MTPLALNLAAGTAKKIMGLCNKPSLVNWRLVPPINILNVFRRRWRRNTYYATPYL